MIFVGLAFFYSISLLGQCPDRDLLWKRLIYMRDSSDEPGSAQLKELLSLENTIAKCPLKDDSTNAFLLRRIGAVYYGLTDYLNAISYYQKSIDIITRNVGNPSITLKPLPSAYYGISVFYGALNNVPERLKALDSCADISIRLNIIDKFCLSALYTRVEYFFDVGDYHRCITYARQCESFAWDYYSANQGANKDGLIYASSSLIWNVNAQLLLNNFSEAEDLLLMNIDKYKRAGLKENLGPLYEQLAELEVSKGQYDQALNYFNQALLFELKAGQIIGCKTILNNIGFEIYYNHFLDDAKAMQNYRKAMKYVNNDGQLNELDSIESLNILTNIANVYVRQGRFDSAFLYFQLAFDQLKPGINERGILQRRSKEFVNRPKIYYLSNLLIDKGIAFQKKYESAHQIADLNEAISIYRIADEFLDRIKAEQFDLESKLFWRKSTRRLFENAIEASCTAQNYEAAFYFFEKSRAVLLNDQLNEQKWLNERDIFELAQAKRKILNLERELGDLNISAEKKDGLQNELFRDKRELDRLTQLVRIRNPLYYQSFLDSNVVNLNDVRENLLKDHDALVELFVGDKTVYSLCVTSGSIFHTSMARTVFDSLTRSYTTYLSDPLLLNKEFPGFVDISHALFQLIFQNNQLPGGRIIISPDGNYFPFESLVINKQPLTYFVKRWAVSYTYSARYLLNRFMVDSARNGGNFLGIAPVRFGETMKLASLEGSQQSLERISGYFENPKNLVGSRASRNDFMNQFFKYKIIQLYTHASDMSDRREPVLFFSDSALYLSELMADHKPITQLVVLSACETGKGLVNQGEGVFSFNRAFAALGIPASIANLWSVENESTYLLTELFHKNLAKGLPMDLALQKAKIEFMESRQGKTLPYYWAATILVGNTDKIHWIERNSRTYLIILVAVFAIMSLGGLWFLYKKMGKTD